MKVYEKILDIIADEAYGERIEYMLERIALAVGGEIDDMKDEIKALKQRLENYE